MATNKKITELPAATLPIATGVKFEAVQAGINVQVDADDMPGSGGGTSIPFGSTSGTNTYTIAATPAVTAYTNGMLLHVKVVNGSTNLSTFNFDSVGAKKVYITPDTQITVGMLVSNHEYIFAYDSALDSAAGGFLLVGDYNHGLLNSRTNSFDASGGAYPSTLGSGPAGAIKHFDAFMVSVAGQMPGGGPFLKNRDWLIALGDTPGNTPANWGYIISQKLYTSTGTNTDGSMDQNSITNAINAATVGLWDDRGTFSAAGGAYPSTGGSGTAGAILKGDIWTISVAGTLPTGQVVEVGDTVRALIDTPGNTQANWAILQNNVGYVPENVANKATGFGTLNNTLYPTTQAVSDRITAQAPKVIQLACSDEVSPITAAANKIKFRMPYAMTLTAVRASLSTAQTSGSIFTIDINEGGTTILSTKLTIDNTETTSTTAATAPVISDTTLADDVEISIDVDQIGDNTAKGLKVTLIGV